MNYKFYSQINILFSRSHVDRINQYWWNQIKISPILFNCWRTSLFSVSDLLPPKHQPIWQIISSDVKSWVGFTNSWPQTVKISDTTSDMTSEDIWGNSLTKCIFVSSGRGSGFVLRWPVNCEMFILGVNILIVIYDLCPFLMSFNVWI